MAVFWVPIRAFLEYVVILYREEVCLNIRRLDIVQNGLTRDKDKPADRIFLARPMRILGIDLSCMRLDALSLNIMEHINGNNTVKQIIDATGARASEVTDRIDLLHRGRLIYLSSKERSISSTVHSREPPVSTAPVSRQPTPVIEKLESPVKKCSQDPVTGSLETDDAKAVIAKAVKNTFSGSVRFEKNGDTITFHFIDGKPMGVVATAKRHDHGTMLHRAGMIEIEILRKYRAEMSQNPAPVQALRRAGIPDKKTMAKFLFWRAETLYREVLGWFEGTYSVSANAPFPPGIARYPLRLRGSTGEKNATFLKTRLTEEQTRLLLDNRSRYLVSAPNALHIASKIRLGEKEERYVKHVLEEAPMQLSRAMAISTLLKATTRKILLYLIEEGVFDFHDVNPEGNAPVPLEDLEPLCKRLETENHFAVLTAHAVSTEKEINSRYERRIRQFDPGRYPGAKPEHLETLARIRSRIDRALDVLRDTNRRREYRKSIYTAFQLENFFHLQIEKAEAALRMRQRPAEALPIALSAWDLCPGSPVARTIVTTSLKALNRTNETSVLLN